MLTTLPDLSLSQIPLPLQLCKLRAGFPSPALDYVEDRLTLNDIVKLDPRYCYLCLVEGDSMIDYGIQPGDVAVISRRDTARPGKIVVISIDGQNTLKMLSEDAQGPVLLAGNSAYPSLRPLDGEEWVYHGVLIACTRLF
ncbi:LexA family protein [Stutzerimonas nitrititolerans]|uniref:LexA family protein n=1 Tax=Stutzerimonas nitrititolerans TaxID=2482751 RepID=UPI0028985350|nr:S24 family peptidase [Stutzerimonas nitrititolerans]